MSDNRSITEELEEILTEVAQVKNLTNFKVKPDSDVQVGDGLLSQFFKGEIQDLDSGESITVALKKVPMLNSELRVEYDYGSIFYNEINFYTKVYPALLALQQEAQIQDQFDNIAEYYTSRMAEERTFISLEHLSPKGYVLHDKKQFLTKQQLEMIFRTYGKFHALSFALRKQNYAKYLEIVDGFKDAFDLFTNTESIKKKMIKVMNFAINNLEINSPELEACKRVFSDLIPVIEQSFVYPGRYRCITHGDCWSNNLLFKYSDTGLENFKMIDFQLSRDGTPIHDLSYLFYSGASKSDMDNLGKYLQIYHNSLSRALEALNEDPEEIFSYKMLEDEWKKNSLMGVVLGVYLWHLKLMNKEDFVDALQKADKGKQVKEDTTKMFEDLVDFILNGQEFKTRSAVILKHAFEFGILSEYLNKQ